MFLFVEEQANVLVHIPEIWIRKSIYADILPNTNNAWFYFDRELNWLWSIIYGILFRVRIKWLEKNPYLLEFCDLIKTNLSNKIGLLKMISIFLFSLSWVSDTKGAFLYWLNILTANSLPWFDSKTFHVAIFSSPCQTFWSECRNDWRIIYLESRLKHHL